MFESLASRPILAHRRRLGLSQADLAQAAGVTRQAVAAIESGRVQPTVAVALAIARRLEMSVEELFGGGPQKGELDAAPGAAGVGAGTRVALASIGGRLVARPVDGPGLSSGIVEAAAGIVNGTSGEGLRVGLLAGADAIDRTVFLAGCDLGAGLLARRVPLHAPGHSCLWFPTSNDVALRELALGRVHLAAVHLAEEADRSDAAAGTASFEVSSLEEGWLVARGNPLHLTGARDLVRRQARLVNRPRGSGARSLLDAELRRCAVAPASLGGYRHVLSGQLDVARAIAQDFADVAVGIGAAARVFGLDFIPLRAERCLLVVAAEAMSHPSVAATIETLRSRPYRRDLEALGAYDTRRTGERVA